MGGQPKTSIVASIVLWHRVFGSIEKLVIAQLKKKTIWSQDADALRFSYCCWFAEIIDKVRDGPARDADGNVIRQPFRPDLKALPGFSGANNPSLILPALPSSSAPALQHQSSNTSKPSGNAVGSSAGQQWVQMTEFPTGSSAAAPAAAEVAASEGQSLLGTDDVVLVSIYQQEIMLLSLLLF